MDPATNAIIGNTQAAMQMEGQTLAEMSKQDLIKGKGGEKKRKREAFGDPSGE